MANISDDDVRQLARLSSLQLTDSEVEQMAQDIESILGYVEQLSELDTSNVEPTYQVTELENVWRDDQVSSTSDERETLLALAADTKDNQIRVPKVL